MRARLLGTCLLLALTTGCSDDPVRTAGAVQGTWALVDSAGNSFYLRVAANEIVAWNEDPAADCFERVRYAVLDIDGRDFRLASPNDTFEVELRRDEDVLVLSASNLEVRYQPSSIDPETLPVCAPPSPVAVCAELPALPLDADLEGALEVTDAENPDGSRYDLYRLDVAAPDSFRIDMGSTVDSYLILYDSLGMLLEENDDASDLTLDARIARILGTACHMVMATSAQPAAFGDYTLRVTLP